MKTTTLLFTVLFVFGISQNSEAQQSTSESQVFEHIKSRLGTPDSEYMINSTAACEGPDGLYISEIESKPIHLKFRQTFTYREESRDLIIEGEKGVSASGEKLSDFMVFYARMHDYIRIALNPEYLIHETDSIEAGDQHIMIFGQTSEYKLEYKTDLNYLPQEYTFYITEEQYITTKFESWKQVNNAVWVPSVVRIIDGEKIFTFNYTEILVSLLQ